MGNECSNCNNCQKAEKQNEVRFDVSLYLTIESK